MRIGLQSRSVKLDDNNLKKKEQCKSLETAAKRIDEKSKTYSG